MKALLVSICIVVLTCCSLPSGAKSLWNHDSPANHFFSTGNASRVGDILTIEIEESSTATEVADSESKRNSTLMGKFSAIFNNDFAKSIFGESGGDIDYPALQFDGQNDFKGETEVERSGTFRAQVAATIVMIDDNGNFLIEARKTINVGKETKSIILSGKVRPRDISAENVVLSSRIADAQISYEGGGSVTSGADPGIFSRMFRIFF